MTNLKVGVYGAAGYTAGELMRLLVNHPAVGEIVPQSGSQAGKQVSDIHTDLIGEVSLEFVLDLDLTALDVLFLCKGHGESRAYLEGERLPGGLKVIDLSHDYRLKANSEGFVYGLPELNGQQVANATRIANPGCFATCIQLGLLPAASAGAIQSEIHTTAITGSTGAGQKLSPTSHFSWREGNISIYKAFTHQHLGEIGESMEQASGQSHVINFIPYRGNFTRGIIASSYFNTNMEPEEIQQAYQDYYQDSPFTHFIGVNPDLKMVVNTNKCVVYIQKEGDKLLVVSAIDNLLKGASGQAVQNMNLMLGIEEAAGLKLKASNF